MTSWALLLLASVLLATPGLTFSGLSPEGNDLMTGDLGQEKQFLESLVLESPQGDRLALRCKTCKLVIEALRKAVEHNITREAIKLAATMVCKKTLPLQHVCKELVTKCLDKIIHGIMNGKSHEEICVKLKICKSEKGLGASGVSDATLGRSTESPTTPPASALPDPEPTLQCLSANFSLASPEGE
ncbi:antimicrobial peptide NK-lysin-like isoform X1 [Neofelis nebulosa]|uniref:antimicrobial peptide NK-lysin-like isoform X1 n=2 Tax=Neofelis nebulosa TaxID=61452 RepID=UPI00272A79F1|nr:antimicrobial peptide NK-lysin-like isoform X1 [Neofelis nebulosa]XP_058539442.1 antimicrobial peptide NK-lysin-like isoform X1 [Neofelis nebulosa]